MPQSYKLLISADACADLDEIFQYISEELSNPAAAVNLIDKIRSALANVCAFPESCPKINNSFVRNQGLRKLIVDNYIAFYEVKAELQQIVVIRIMYGMQNYFDVL